MVDMRQILECCYSVHAFEMLVHMGQIDKAISGYRFINVAGLLVDPEQNDRFASLLKYTHFVEFQ